MKPVQTNQSGKVKSVFVVMVGDEGAILLQIQKKQVVKRLFAQSPEPEHVKAFNDIISANPKLPITLLVDMMDQSYVRQTLPPVSSFNVGKIIRRRLNKDFSGGDIKGYIVFGRDKTGRKDWNYLMASLANTPVLQKWIDFVVERPNPFKGIGLVPLECQSMIKAIDAAYLARPSNDKPSTEWHILISHHKVGGFRQIVVRNGTLVFTRLAQMVGDPTPEVIAGNIEQELLNTLEYLKRLGLQDTSNLTVTIVASSEIKEVFDIKSIRAERCFFFSPHEMASLLSLNNITKPEDHFGDVVVLGYIGTKRKLTLTLFTSYTQKVARLILFHTITRVVTAAAILGLLVTTALSGLDWLDALASQDNLKKQNISLNSQYAETMKQKAILPTKVDFYSDVEQLYKYFYKVNLDPLYFVHSLPDTIKGLALVRNLHWSTGSSPIGNPQQEDKRQITGEFETLLITPQEPRDVFVKNAQRLVENIKDTYIEYDVTNSELPGVLSESKEIRTVVDDTGSKPVSVVENFNLPVRFTVKGPVKKDEASMRRALPASRTPGGR